MAAQASHTLRWLTAETLREYTDGMTMAEAARQFDLSTAELGAICQREGVQRVEWMPRKYPFVEPLHERVRLTQQVLEQHFCMSIADVSKKLGWSPASIRQACRRHGILVWPFGNKASLPCWDTRPGTKYGDFLAEAAALKATKASEAAALTATKASEAAARKAARDESGMFSSVAGAKRSLAQALRTAAEAAARFSSVAAALKATNASEALLKAAEAAASEAALQVAEAERSLAQGYRGILRKAAANRRAKAAAHESILGCPSTKASMDAAHESIRHAQAATLKAAALRTPSPARSLDLPRAVLKEALDARAARGNPLCETQSAACCAKRKRDSQLPTDEGEQDPASHHAVRSWVAAVLCVWRLLLRPASAFSRCMRYASA